jgi:glycosyltransferase involved in cell wall biosynthesis
VTGTVTVAIPTRDGGPLFEQTLAAVRAQVLEHADGIQVLVCDSGSRDGSVALARRYGADVIEIAPGEFSHGGTRNLLMRAARGDHVAFLTQDAVPADERWLDRLLGAFGLAEDVALTFGPYRPRADASPMVARELTEWFRSFSPEGSARVDRLERSERAIPSRALLGPRGFFTDANGCVARWAWESAPFRAVGYAEDHMLAHDMLRAGYAKVYVPDAGVIHSHEYSGLDWLRRNFDEARALREVYGFAQPAGPRSVALQIWGRVGADRRWFRDARHEEGLSAAQITLLVRSLRYHLLCTAGRLLGGRSPRLPRAASRRLSLEGRAS